MNSDYENYGKRKDATVMTKPTVIFIHKSQRILYGQVSKIAIELSTIKLTGYRRLLRHPNFGHSYRALCLKHLKQPAVAEVPPLGA